MDDRLSSDLASLRIDRNERPPSPSSARAVRWLIGTAVVAGSGLAAWHVAAPDGRGQAFQDGGRGDRDRARLPRAGSGRSSRRPGTSFPQVEVDVSSKLVGRVEKSTVHEGSVVKVGEILFELDASDQRTQVASAQARVAAARAREATSRAQLAETELQLQREQRLAASGAVGTATADDLAARAKSLAEQVHATEADVAASQTEVTALSVNLANTTIRAPIDGTVITKPLQPGDVVSPGTPMARIADFNSIVVETDVPEARLHLVKKGGPCEIVLDAYPDKRWRGEVVDTSPQLNRAKATATVKVRFLDRDATVLPEMAARVSFLDAPLDVAKLSERPEANRPGQRGGRPRRARRWSSPLDAGKVRMTPVTLGPPFGDGFELVDGPAPGTKIVSDPGSRRSATGRQSRRGARDRRARKRAPRPAASIVKLQGRHEDVRARRRGRARARRPRPRRADRLVRGAHGAVGLGQDDAPQPHRGPRSAEQRERRGRGQAARRAERGRARQVALEHHRLRLPVVQPAPGARRRSRTSSCRCCSRRLGSAERKKRAQTALRVVGLEDRMQHYPRQLSGGQEQRVAIARAIVNDPTIIVADEPTGDLDRKRADDILALLEKLNTQLGKTILMVTHDPAAAERASIIRRLDKGKLVS